MVVENGTNKVIVGLVGDIEGTTGWVRLSDKSYIVCLTREILYS